MSAPTGIQPVAIVTGGASGIGLAIVRHLLGGGMAVVAIDRDAGLCAAAQKSLASFGTAARVVTGDIATKEGANLAVEVATEAFGRLDLLCNNAAVHPLVRLEEQSLESWRETIGVNLDGALLCSQAALPPMKRQGSGVIVNIGSISGRMPYATGGAYAVSKAALEMLTRVLALETGPYGIRVNCIAPGAIRHRAGVETETGAWPGNPVGRRGTPADVAHLVSYLASDAAHYMTGAVIALDGGATAGRVRA